MIRSNSKHNAIMSLFDFQQLIADGNLEINIVSPK